VPRKADFNRFGHAFDLVRVIAAKGRTRRLARPASVRAAGGRFGPALLTQPRGAARRRTAEETLAADTQHNRMRQGPYSGALRCARTSRTSWSLCVAGTTSAEGERSAPLP
jgi:hypothetical protein